MSDFQDKINQILSDPEAMKQVQSLGAQLGISADKLSAAPAPPKSEDDAAKALSSLAPLMNSYSSNDEITALLNALKPFLSAEKAQKLEQAQRLIRMIKIIPLIKDSGMFF